jgi:DNA-nicking Smr family endonuclease
MDRRDKKPSGPRDEGAEEDDAELFRRAMRDVQPLKSSRRIPEARRRAPPRARFARAERAQVLRESLGWDSQPSGTPGTDLYELQPGDELLFHRAGVPETLLRRLRRGLYRVDYEIDLHGLTVAEASVRLSELLRAARQQGLRCIRVIHGKGLRSGTRGPVLKNAVNAQLRRTGAVLAFASARPRAGGTGATLVLLRS